MLFLVYLFHSFQYLTLQTTSLYSFINVVHSLALSFFPIISPYSTPLQASFINVVLNLPIPHFPNISPPTLAQVFPRFIQEYINRLAYALASRSSETNDRLLKPINVVSMYECEYNQISMNVNAIKYDSFPDIQVSVTGQKTGYVTSGGYRVNFCFVSWLLLIFLKASVDLTSW